MSNRPLMLAMKFVGLLLLMVVFFELLPGSPVLSSSDAYTRHMVTRGGLELVEVGCQGVPHAGDSAACYVFPPGQPLPTDLGAALGTWAAEGRRYLTLTGSYEPVTRHAPPAPPLELWQAGGFAGLFQTLPRRVFMEGGGHEIPDAERNFVVLVLAHSGPSAGELPTEFREAAAWLSRQPFPGFVVMQAAENEQAFP